MSISPTSFQKGGILLLLTCNLVGCSTLQSWFPDKEKDYQFTTELPPLVIPPDLIQKSSVLPRSVPVEIPVLKTEKPATQIPEAIKNNKKVVTKKIDAVVEPTLVKSANRPALTETETEISRDEIQVSLTHENAPTLNLNVPSERAWRIVGKALSRSGIEVTNRNQEKGEIHIEMMDSKTKIEPEKNLWDDTISVFNPFSENEKSYILKFSETNSKTAITALNGEFQSLTDGDDNRLLTILFEAIKSDLSK